MSHDRVAKRRKLSPPAESPAKIIKSVKSAEKVHQAKPKKGLSVSNRSFTKSDDSRTDQASHSTSQEPLSLPSVKDLASSESSLRRANLKTILAHLTTRPASQPLSETECLQLWRGFHVAIYMHDSKNQISVQNVIREVAGTFGVVAGKDDDTDRTEWLTMWHTTFWVTMVREWSGIDSHRMNKFLFLVRCVVKEIGKICFSGIYGKDGEAVNIDAVAERMMSVTEILKTVGPLNCRDRKIPDGLRLHFLDLIADEISGVLDEFQKGEGEEKAAKVKKEQIKATVIVLEAFQAPLIDMAKGDSGAQRHVRMRAKEALQSFKTRQEELEST